MTTDPTAAVRWLDRRFADSDLIRLYFGLREAGLDAARGAEVVGTLADVYILGRCAFLATVAARKVGRDRFVGFYWPDGRLVHAVVACAPQHSGEPLRGHCLDVLGRWPLAGMAAEIAAFVGPVDVAIGEMAEDGDFLDGEPAAVEAICAQLPWLRSSLLMPEPPESGPDAFMAAGIWAEHVRARMAGPHPGEACEGDADRPPS